MEWHEWVRTLAPIATTVAVLLAALQLAFNRSQAKASFEDDLNREYRGIAAELPLEAFAQDAGVTRQLTPAEKKAMFRYFDLSNEQLRITKQGWSPGRASRISRSTRRAWSEGIEQNMRLPTFGREWRLVRDVVPGHYFTELSKLPELGEHAPIAVDDGSGETSPRAAPPPALGPTTAALDEAS